MDEEMTVRAQAAILLKVPDSGIEWLNEMIVQSRRLDVVTACLTGAAVDSRGERNNTTVGTAFGIANLVANIASGNMK